MTKFLPHAAWATLVANIVIVVTGGAVRLTGSGLGCPTWPECHDGSYTPHGELNIHSAIEFGNRTLTFVLVAVAVFTFVVAWRSGRRDLRRLAALLAFGIPAQAIIGGITVLTDLNPWIVSLHLLCSMAMIGLAVLFLRLLPGPLPSSRRGPVSWLAWATFATAWVVLYLGTVVTGSGPHAGDEDAPRNGLDPLQMSQLHADAVMLFIGLSIGLLLFAVLINDRSAVRAAMILLGVEVAQSVIGFVQYFTDLPVLLVGLHMLGASVLTAAMTWVVLQIVRPSAPQTSPA